MNACEVIYSYKWSYNPFSHKHSIWMHVEVIRMLMYWNCMLLLILLMLLDGERWKSHQTLYSGTFFFSTLGLRDDEWCQIRWSTVRVLRYQPSRKDGGNSSQNESFRRREGEGILFKVTLIQLQWYSFEDLCVCAHVRVYTLNAE